MTTHSSSARTDEELVRGFETCSLPSLSHEDHVRLAYLYLRRPPLADVLAEFPRKLRRYAESKGMPALYHETITWAYLVLIHEGMRKDPSKSWGTFAALHPELLESSALTRGGYYSRAELDSELAREVFVLPRARRSRASSVSDDQSA